MSLGERLEAIREKASDRIPTESLEIMHRATQELAASGILEGVSKVGQRLPDFELYNTTERLVSSEDLLAEGPLVVSFFRGRW